MSLSSIIGTENKLMISPAFCNKSLDVYKTGLQDSSYSSMHSLAYKFRTCEYQGL